MFWIEFENNSNGKEYEVEAICNNRVYAKESDTSYLLGLYYLVSYKGYSEEENT